MDYSGLEQFKTEIRIEVNRILEWWRSHAIDEVNGGFYGEIKQDNTILSEADKGGILNARILWTFSATYRKQKREKDIEIAHRAYQYIRDNFYDHDQGGTYWSLYKDGSVKDTRKQIYSIAFTVYGLSEYFKITKDVHALYLAIDLFNTIEKHSRDKSKGGYFEAYSKDWILLEDLRLSEKDRNDPKTMNTHLHIIEAYANLYTVWKNRELREAIIHLLELFDEFIIDKKTAHLNLFFDATWNKTSQAISYGHDIEASWLLHACATALGDDNAETYWRNKAIRIANAAREGVQADGSFIHEYNPEQLKGHDYREWWVSAEGLAGFINAYTITKNEEYLSLALQMWNFIKQHLIDTRHGEWYWGVQSDYTKTDMYKMGFWKCPYHNVRACLEVLQRLEGL